MNKQSNLNDDRFAMMELCQQFLTIEMNDQNHQLNDMMEETDHRQNVF
jgi:hypothetical protein